MRQSVLAIVTSVLLAGSAAASDVSVIGDYQLRGGASFSGVQVGLTIGHAEMSDEFTLAPGITAEGDGMTYGGFAAYNHQSGNIVAGAEVAWAKHDNEFTDGSGVILEDLFSAKIRGGLAFGRVNAYGLAGISRAKTNIVGSDWGINFGAGIDALLTSNIVVGGQYNYHYFGNFNDVAIDAELHELSGRVAYKF